MSEGRLNEIVNRSFEGVPVFRWLEDEDWEIQSQSQKVRERENYFWAGESKFTGL